MSACVLEDNFPAWKEADRLAALRKLEILDTERDKAFDDIAKLAARMCNAAIAMVTFIDEERQWFKSEIGLGIQETPLDISICVHAILQPGLFVVPDTTKDHRFLGNPLISGERPIRFYAGALIETDEGLPLGTLCVLDYAPRPEGVTKEQAETLISLARAVMSQLKLRQANKALTESEERHRALIEASSAMIWRASADGSILKGWGWEDFCGQTSEEYQGYGWLDAVHPNDREGVKSVWSKILASGQPGAIEYRVRNKDGEYRWVFARGAPLKNLDGCVREWVGTITDIHEQKIAAERLRMSEERYRALIQASASVVWLANPEGLMSGVFGGNKLSGQGFDEYANDGWLNAVHPDDQSRVRAEWEQIVASGEPGAVEFRFCTNDISHRWVLARSVPLKTPTGVVREWVGTLTDINARKQAEEALRASEERLRLALQAGRMIAWEQDLTTNYVTRSDNSIDLLGIGSSPLSDFLERVPPEDQPLRGQFLDRINRERVGTIEFRYRLPDGETLWLASRGERAGPDRVVGVSYDITERKEVEEELWRLANHDSLTGLPNRSLFQHRLEEALALAKDDGKTTSLLLIDLDDFKDVNDSFGHDAGDALLKETAVRLSGTIRDGDTVARLGGDEFALLIRSSARLDQAISFAENLTRRLSQPFSYAGQAISSRASIGLAAFPDHDAEPAELMKDADIALYRAKAKGRNCVVSYSPEMRAIAERRFILRRDMRKAISRDQITPYYQPKVCLTTGRIVGFEALARWQHTSMGLLTPSVFGDAFEDPELAALVGKRLIGKVASDMRRWLNCGLNFGRVAVNLSQVEFIQPDMADDILRVLDLAKVPTEHFEVEITERVLVDARSGTVIPALERFRERGVQIALDDFGTGYASLTYLKQFPVDHIKIDQSFVRDIEDDPDDEAIVTAVVGLGRSLKLQVTAEGVEKIGQAQRLREMGCGIAQGYLYAKPVAASDVPGLLSNWMARLVPPSEGQSAVQI